MNYRMTKIIGDPHKNRWGSHNNSWGHRGRNKNNKTAYEPSPLFNKLALGVCLFLCGTAGSKSEYKISIGSIFYVITLVI